PRDRLPTVLAGSAGVHRGLCGGHDVGAGGVRRHRAPAAPGLDPDGRPAGDERLHRRRTQPVISRPLDRLDSPNDPGRSAPRLWLPLERSRLLRCRGWSRRLPRTDLAGCPRSQEVVSVARLIRVALMLLACSCPALARDASPLAQRGYYITFMRMPTYDLGDW